jgi:hypothetical protein
MQTFAPLPTMQNTAKCLDYRRLGKQRLEARDIIVILTQNTDKIISDKSYTYISKRYRNHPAVKMWRGYVDCLKHYYNVIRYEWVSRGYKNAMPEMNVDYNDFEFPWWWGDDGFHLSHKADSLVLK